MDLHNLSQVLEEPALLSSETPWGYANNKASTENGFSENEVFDGMYQTDADNWVGKLW